MGYVRCRSCDGLGQKTVWRDGNRHQPAGYKTFPCKACNGSGINQNLYSKSCEKCGAEIIYPRDSSYPPKYCKSCKQTIQKEKEQKAAKWKEASCKKCGAKIKYNTDWDKIPNTCKPCIEKEKAKWKTTTCKKCGSTIKYNTDWGNIPDICKPCIEKEKAKWKSVRCKWCHSEFKVNSDWKNKPELCKTCQQKVKDGQEEKATIWRRFRLNHEPIDKLPTQVVWNRHDTFDTPHHMTMKYSDGYRVSWEATKYGDFGFHWTNENERGPKRHEPPEDATVR